MSEVEFIDRTGKPLDVKELLDVKQAWLKWMSQPQNVMKSPEIGLYSLTIKQALEELIAIKQLIEKKRQEKK